ncbi:hypothetical protein [Ruegeria meonggei]|nr:hypothetical protein [Ruegeria meonggei]
MQLKRRTSHTKWSLFGLCFSANVLSSLAVFADIGGKSKECAGLSDDALIELAISEMIGNEPGSVSITREVGPTIGLRTAPYPTRTEYLAANPDCCRITTAETLLEAIPPDLVKRLNYHGSVRVATTFRVIGNTEPESYPFQTYNSVRTFDFDACGNTLQLP